MAFVTTHCTCRANGNEEVGSVGEGTSPSRDGPGVADITAPENLGTDVVQHPETSV